MGQGGFNIAVDALRCHQKTAIRWDDTVPEHWVGILYDSANAATMSTDLPLIFVIKSLSQTISKIVDQWKITVIAVDNFDNQIFKIDPEIYRECFPYGQSEMFDPDDFTVGQLVFATI
jgi:hypothetical protein